MERLEAQRAATDASLAGLRSGIDALEGDDRAAVATGLAQISEALDVLAPLRERVVSEDVEADLAYQTYSDAVARLIDLMPEILLRANEPRLTRMMGAFLALSKATEWGAREMAAGAQVLSDGSVSLALASEVSGAEASSQALLDVAADLVGPSMQGQLEALRQQPESVAFNALRERLIGSEYGFLGMANIEWFDSASDAVAGVYQLKQQLAADMERGTDKVLAVARAELRQAAIIGCVVIGAVLLLALLIKLFKDWPLRYGLFSSSCILVALGAENINSLERYALNGFPIILSVLLLASQPRLRLVVPFVSACCMVSLCVFAWLGVYVP